MGLHHGRHAFPWQRLRDEVWILETSLTGYHWIPLAHYPGGQRASHKGATNLVMQDPGEPSLGLSSRLWLPFSTCVMRTIAQASPFLPYQICFSWMDGMVGKELQDHLSSWMVTVLLWDPSRVPGWLGSALGIPTGGRWTLWQCDYQQFSNLLNGLITILLKRGSVRLKHANGGRSALRALLRDI